MRVILFRHGPAEVRDPSRWPEDTERPLTRRGEKRSRRGKIFYGCNRYPECTFASWDKPRAVPCPSCGASFLVEKETKKEGLMLRCLKCGLKFAPETVGA